MLLHLFVCTLSAFTLSFFLIPILTKYSIKYALLDQPTDRKAHLNPTPSLGGVAIFAGFLAVCLFIDSTIKIQTVITVAILIVLVGLYDDLYDLSAGKKALCQVILVSVLYAIGFRLEGLVGIPYLEQFTPFVSYLATVLLFMTLINAYNLIDGIDGLAGSLSLHACLAYAWLFYAMDNLNWSFIALAISAAILGFLMYNFRKASIFMGDNGSMFLGLMIGVFSLEYLQCCGTKTAGTSNLLIVLSIIIIPVMDMARVFFYRLYRGQSPFKADRTHIHHILLDNHLKTTTICISLVLLNIMLVYSIRWLEQLYLPLALFELLLTSAIGMLLICIGSYFLRSKNKSKSMDTETVLEQISETL